MLVAPLVLSTPSPSRRRIPARTLPRPAPASGYARAAWIQVVLFLWLLIGIGAVIAVPAARSNDAFGATLPFWLIGAPLLDLAWLKRGHLIDAVGCRSRSMRLYIAAKRVALPPRRHWQR
jgi:hypothetical protein